MKKTFAIILICVLTAVTMLLPFAAAAEGGYYEEDPLLISLQHNCKNTGKMLPEYFDPNKTSYILTVASWVSRVKFTPVASDPSYTVTVNGQYVAQGTESQIIQMTNDPQQVLITVTSPGGAYRTYTIFLQRRPSERRTRTSAGYINTISVKDGKWYIDADLVTVNYTTGNYSTFANASKEVNKYNYACHNNCIFYYGTAMNATRAGDMNAFMANYDPNGMYWFVYIEDEIVAVMPYAQ